MRALLPVAMVWLAGSGPPPDGGVQPPSEGVVQEGEPLDRALAVSALAAARNAVDQADSTAERREEAILRLKEAEAHFRSARYAEAAKAADGAWQLVSASAREPTRFAIRVEENGKTEVTARSGQPVRVEAQGAAQRVYAGQLVKVAKGERPSAPELVLAAPSPVGPADQARLKEVVLSWKAVSGAKAYQVDLTGPKPQSLKVERARVRLASLPPGRYEWTVRAVSGGGASEPSARRSFEVVERELKLEVGKTKWK